MIQQKIDQYVAVDAGQGNGSQQLLLTIDVEDWFQVENFRQIINPSSWPSFESRVERNTYRLLELFSEIHAPSANTIADPQNNDFNCLTPKAISHKPGIHATFFILGWVAERMPRLVREIHSLGHEVASRGFNHELAVQCQLEVLKNDLIDSKKLLEDIIGGPVYGYRAPSFSINENILRLIEETGFMYDSSYNSFSANSRYGKVDLSGSENVGIAKKISSGFYELPISNIEWAGLVLPAGGGGYFRLYPLCLFALGVRMMLRKKNAYVFYLHPWEIDDEQPRVREASGLSRFRHYVNIDETLGKFSEFIKRFKYYEFPTCKQYLDGFLTKFCAEHHEGGHK